MNCTVCNDKGYQRHKVTRGNSDVNVYQCDESESKYLDRIKSNDYKHGFMNGKLYMIAEEIMNRLKECNKDDSRRFFRMNNMCNNKTVLDLGCGFSGFI